MTVPFRELQLRQPKKKNVVKKTRAQNSCEDSILFVQDILWDWDKKKWSW